MAKNKVAFGGYSLPDGAWLPPELIYILPDISTMSELKVTIAAIYETLRVGVVQAIISLSDFEALTGLDRKSVSRGIESALERGSFRRQRVGNTWLYRLNIQSTPAATTTRGRGTTPLLLEGNGGGMPSDRGTMPADGRGMTPQDGVMVPHNGGATPQARGTTPLHVVGCNTLSNTDEKQQQEQDKRRAALLVAMRDFGVKLALAQKFLQKYDLDYLCEKLEQSMYALEAGFIRGKGPGWFVTSVKENWQAPLGYDDEVVRKEKEKLGRKRYIEGKYGHLIEH